MISSDLVFVQLAQLKGYVCIVELAMMLETSVSQVRHELKELDDRVEHNNKDEWRIIKNVALPHILSKSEKAERDELESTVQQAFFVAGRSLQVLRDKKLYRQTHTTFVKYVRDRFGFSKSGAYHLIGAYKIVENLKCPQIVDTNINTSILPANESQCRFLTKLSPEEQQKAWFRAVELAGNRVPSSKIVKEAVNEIKSIDHPAVENEKVEPEFQELNYTAGMGVEYTVKLDEETYYRLHDYQDKIKTATKSGAVARLLDAIAEQE